MQKSQRTELRTTELEKADWAWAAGGTRKVSDWLRGLANAECERLRLLGNITPVPTGTSGRASEAVASSSSPAPKVSVAGGATPREAGTGSKGIPPCSRERHHRPNTYCGACEKVIK